MTHLLSALLLAASLVAACDDSPAAPSSGPIVLRGAIDRAAIGAGEVGTLSYTAENVSGQDVTLTFSSSCFVGLTFENVATGSSQPAPVACLTVITTRTLRPRESLTQTFRIRGTGSSDPASLALPAGRYRARGVLDTTPRVEAPPVEFTVQ